SSACRHSGMSTATRGGGTDRVTAVECARRPALARMTAQPFNGVVAHLGLTASAFAVVLAAIEAALERPRAGGSLRDRSRQPALRTVTHAGPHQPHVGRRLHFPRPRRAARRTRPGRSPSSRATSWYASRTCSRSTGAYFAHAASGSGRLKLAACAAQARHSCC